jgi:hypothetical protein
MPVELVSIGGVLVGVAGVVIFAVIQRQKPNQPPTLK